MPLPPAAVELLTALSKVLAGWGRWYVFGAQAVIAYGVPRLSADVDVTVKLEPDAGSRPGQRGPNQLRRIHYMIARKYNCSDD